MPAEEASARTPAVIAEIQPERAPLPVLVEAMDAALRSALPDLRVRVPLATGDSRREAVAALIAADPRVEIADPGSPEPAAEIVFELPARARPQPRTLPAIAAVMRERDVGSVDVPVPGRYPALGPLGRPGRLRARGSGSGSARLRAADVGLRSTDTRGRPGPPPKGTLAAERAEHLRHRARSATMRARMDRNAHRLSRERLQTRHERARLRLAEQRVARTGRGEWVRWRARRVGRRIAGAPGAIRSGTGFIRVFFRRARRFAADRWRSRKLQA